MTSSLSSGIFHLHPARRDRRQRLLGWALAGLALAGAVPAPLRAAAENAPERLRQGGAEYLVRREADTGRIHWVKPLAGTAVAGEPAAAARRFLQANAGWLELGDEGRDFRPAQVKETPGGTHVWLVMSRNGRDVVNAGVDFHLDRAGAVALVQLEAPLPGAEWPLDFPSEAMCRAVALDEAEPVVRRPAKRAGGIEPPEPVALRPDGARQVYFLQAGVPLASWEITLAAPDGRERLRCVVGGFPLRLLDCTSNVWRVDATGDVFFPNPVNYLGDETLRDNSPASAFAGAYFDLPLLDLNAVSGGYYYLIGPRVKIVNDMYEPPLVSIPRETSPIFKYDRSQTGFEGVMAYYWLDESIRYLWSLGYTGIVDYQLPVDVHGLSGADDSHYLQDGANGFIAYGDGGVDDAEDADIILHEFGHAIQDSSNRAAFKTTGQPGAIAEGFCDYWAFSSTYESSVLNGFHPYYIGEWDAKGYTPADAYQRRVDVEKVYPADFRYSVHENGQIWSVALKNLFLLLGKPVTDRIVLESHFLMPVASANGFNAGARAMLAADEALYGGQNAYEICREFERRGILTMAEVKALVPWPEVAQATFAEVDGNFNGLPEPGELIELTVTLANPGAESTGPLAATLSSADDLFFYRAETTYPALEPARAAVPPAQPFSFRIDRDWPCGESVNLRLEARFGSHAQAWEFNLPLGEALAPVVLLADGLETPNDLWRTDAAPGSTTLWYRTTSTAHSHGGRGVWSTFGLAQVNDDYLIWGPLGLPAGHDYTLSFWHDFDFQEGYDGGLIEVSLDGYTWTNLDARITQGGYDFFITGEFGSLIKDERAWTLGSLDVMEEVRVDLSPWAGKQIFLRLRFGTDSQQTSYGWYVDDFTIYQDVCECVYVPGDLNADGARDALDLALLAGLLAENETAGPGSPLATELAGDIRVDGKVNILDLLDLQLWLIGG